MLINRIKIAIISLIGFLIASGIYSCSFEYNYDYIIENDSGEAVTLFFRTLYSTQDSVIIGTNITESFFIDSEGLDDLGAFDSISIVNVNDQVYTKNALDPDIWEIVDIKKYEKTFTLTLKEDDFN